MRAANERRIHNPLGRRPTHIKTPGASGEKAAEESGHDTERYGCACGTRRPGESFASIPERYLNCVMISRYLFTKLAIVQTATQAGRNSCRPNTNITRFTCLFNGVGVGLVGFGACEVGGQAPSFVETRKTRGQSPTSRLQDYKTQGLSSIVAHLHKWARQRRQLERGRLRLPLYSMASVTCKDVCVVRVGTLCYNVIQLRHRRCRRRKETVWARRQL